MLLIIRFMGIKYKKEVGFWICAGCWWVEDDGNENYSLIIS